MNISFPLCCGIGAFLKRIQAPFCTNSIVLCLAMRWYHKDVFNNVGMQRWSHHQLLDARDVVFSTSLLSDTFPAARRNEH